MRVQESRPFNMGLNGNVDVEYSIHQLPYCQYDFAPFFSSYISYHERTTVHCPSLHIPPSIFRTIPNGSRSAAIAESRHSSICSGCSYNDYYLFLNLRLRYNVFFDKYFFLFCYSIWIITIKLHPLKGIGEER